MRISRKRVVQGELDVVALFGFQNVHEISLPTFFFQPVNVILLYLGCRKAECLVGGLEHEIYDFPFSWEFFHSDHSGAHGDLYGESVG
jgi:hypothetical protein